MSSPSLLSLFVPRPGDSRRRNSSFYRSLYYGGSNGIPRVIKRRTMKDEIILFYARLNEDQLPIPLYLTKTVYARLVEQQRELFSKLQDASNKSSTPSAQELANLEHLFNENSFYYSIAIQDLRLPSAWDTNSVGDNIEFSTDCLQLTFKGGDKEEDEASASRANHPMRKQCGIYYFEIKINSKGVDGHIGIGFCTKINSLNRLPGWEDRSWGYHGNDGQVRSGPGANKQYGPKFSTGDIIGCGIDYRDMSAFFTKNGIHLGIAFRKIKETDLYPFVGFKTQGEQIEANFGLKPFKFDIQQYMSNEKRRVLNTITSCSSSSSSNTINDAITSHLADQVVMEYLEHHGYNKSAKVLESALISKRESTGASMDENDIDLDDAETLQRQDIRKSILNGDIDKAIELCNAHYPEVLNNNPWVLFRLKCRKFIEMVKVAQLNSSTAASASNTAESLQISNTEGKRPMEIVCDLPNKKQKINEEDPLSKVMLYGMELKREYSNEAQENEAMATELRTTFATLAYTNLSHPAVSHLYQTPCIEQVATQVNSALLVSLDRYPNSSLERIYRQTSVSIEKLVIMGNSSAALLEPER
ncbi:SPRY-domain-containing protein, partial [Backusella circina FSU 941]